MRPLTVLAWGPQAERAAAAGADSNDVWICSSADEVRERLRGSRRWSFVLLDGSLPDTDRDLVLACTKNGARAIVIDAQRRADWTSMGATAVASVDAALSQLFDLQPMSEPQTGSGSPRGALVAVTGPGGTGASTTAAAIAQGLVPGHGPVVLIDMVRNAEQHVLHGLAPDAPGIAEMVEAHRGREPAPEALLSSATVVSGRGYRVIGGLRRAVAWSALPPAAVGATLENLRRAFRMAVADLDPDLEGESDTGSPDVEERNSMARHAFPAADVTVVVVRPGLKGTHSGLRVLTNLWTHGVDPARTLAAVIGGHPEDTDGLRSSFDRLGANGGRAIEVPDVQTESLLIHGLPLPSTLVDPVVRAVTPLLAGGTGIAVKVPERVQPGSLGVASDRYGRRD